MSIRAIVYVMACVAVGFSFSASAATVVPYAGTVFVNQGYGFQKVNGVTEVKVGDSVMVGPDGRAQVRLDNGKVVTVSPGQVLTVPARVRVKTAVLPVAAVPETVLVPQADNGNVLGLLAVGALGAAGVAGAIALSPASP